VKLSDTAEAVAKVIAEKTAGRERGGSVDLIWINGANFASLKGKNLLFGPWADHLPNRTLVDATARVSLDADFTVPVEGFESPWDMAQLVFFFDSARVTDPPRTIRDFLAYARAHAGRVTMPDAQNFLGVTFLKQALFELNSERDALQRPATDADFKRITSPLWSFLDEIRPYLWRRGEAYPSNSAELRQLLADREIDIAFSFNPSEAALAIARKELPATVSAYVLDGGTIANASFVAIPFNAAHKAGAMVLANFLLSPEAQARKLDPQVWGGLTVLDVEALPPEDRARFDTVNALAAKLPGRKLGPVIPEPHPTWATRIAEEWIERYASQ
jgi:putative thiamine transport system substrate-binding protein